MDNNFNIHLGLEIFPKIRVKHIIFEKESV